MDLSANVDNNNSTLQVKEKIKTEELEIETAKSLEKLRGQYDTHRHTLYQAGIPQYPGNFTRDGVISGILMQNSSMLKGQLIFCAEKQGVKQDSRTGEEVGKIFHEFPGVVIENRSTEYAACDTTALFLIGHEAYQKMTGDDSLQTSQKENIKKAVEYILRHINDGKFIEDPVFSLADHYALKVTYWKDSEMSERHNGEPIYPVVYTLAHIQNMRGLKSAKWLLENQSLEETIKKMERVLLERLFDISSGHFYLAIDSKGPIRSISSDNLHALFYLEPGVLDEKKLQSIIEASLPLETEAGFRTLSPASAVFVKDALHTQTIWPFEQAIIHNGARKHRIWAEQNRLHELAGNLEHVENICFRVMNWMDSNPELLTIDSNRIINKSSEDPQLWSVAAKKYFMSDYRKFGLI